MSINPDLFKKALQDWASGVTVVTTASATHGLLGMTATSFSSVSMEPPHILVCINDAAITASGIQESQHFAVNILSKEQQHISNLFAGAASVAERFDSVTWRKGIQGVPLLDDSITSLECKVVQQIRSGTHWVIIGEVLNATCRSGEPLMYFRTKYQTMKLED
jgi:flavin reductase (DIM6/NTAB) family NADH-FMN oxidoreductase RutF